ncbi:uncharacterized protein F4817DRAFT_69838 [Daldinia loculata]|uniref:uncharacterized protein n=1 Tax=Daldinia loculata TaxID=103429 RepID=UPI0020C36610|nr:uncharacterized protein F4817DRAFT_69838 [Daldinia loculata]KAI1648282.1 hypothetical protein F4817DRAFT_69838 [Daldinia loculata]
MARKAAKSVAAAEKRAIACENESQDSQDMLEMHMLRHGVGVLSSSPAPMQPPYQSKRSALVSSIRPTKANISHSLDRSEEALKITKERLQNASNALIELSAEDDSMKQSSQTRLNSNSSVSCSPYLPSTLEPGEPDLASIQSICDNAISTVERPTQPIINDALPTLQQSNTPKGRSEEMSSGSPTQSNDGRSYEQYNDNSQLQLTSQASSVHEHPTLGENDTGYLNFRRTHYDIPDSIPEGDEEEAEIDFASIAARKSQPTSEAPRASGQYAAPPETPTITQKLFQHRGDEAQLIPPSQLFGQTQWTSAVRKASPTSSRPSPDVFNQNTISPNPVASSPLKHKGLRTSPTRAFTSSPTFPGISSRPSDEKTPSVPTNSHEDEGTNQGNDDETPLPCLGTSRRRTVPEPISEYKSCRKRNLENEATDPSSQVHEGLDSDSEADLVAYRRRLARLKQEKASKSFPSVSLPRAGAGKGGNVEVPSTSRVKSFQGRSRTNAEQYLVKYHGETATDNNKSQETVADSQEHLVPPQHTKAEPKISDDSDEKDIGNAGNSNINNFSKSRAPLSNMEYRETIPETSPPSTSVEPPKLLDDGVHLGSSAMSESETLPLPALSNGINPGEQQKDSSGTPNLPEQPTLISAGRKPRSTRDQSTLDSSPSVVLASSPQSAIRQSVRLNDVVTPSSTGRDLPPASDPRTGTSTLSTLSATPSMSSSITPSTDPDVALEGVERRSSSPAVTKVQRRGRQSLPSSLPQTKTFSRSRESLRRKTRYSSVSTDELARSPLSASDRNERKPPTRKLARQSFGNQHPLQDSTANRGIFEGMVFALSFQGPQVRKNKGKPTDRANVERMIRQEGGKILPDGFDELFKFDSFQATGNNTSSRDLSSSLTLLDQDIGFTALIADGHSRKVKYMQALALGIPCLAPKWIMNCISKREIIDWSSYLLCAGPSTLLGEAIRSRNLQPYDASTAKLADVVNERPKLLNKARILLVMKKTKNEGKKLPYVFLAQVLGGSLVRVYSLEEARVKLRDEESQNRPFDWVYVDDSLHNAQDALFGSSTGNTATRKRKRQSTGSEEADPPPKRIRTLSDELVIQSLILGRLIEDGEMEE